MYRYKDVKIRKFTFDDIPLKIEWINNSANNAFLHYDLPLEYEKTCQWYERNKTRTDRFDAVIEYENRPVGLIGILGIDQKNKKGEDYVLVGDVSVKGHGIATKAGILNMAYAFYELGLNKLTGVIECGNISSLRQCRKRGGVIEGYLHDHIFKDGKFVDCYTVAYLKSLFQIPEEVFQEDCQKNIGGGGYNL